jgi:hypothetical protein
LQGKKKKRAVMPAFLQKARHPEGEMTGSPETEGGHPLSRAATRCTKFEGPFVPGKLIGNAEAINLNHGTITKN